MMLGNSARRLAALLRDRRGVTAIEYGLIGAFIFLAIVAALTSVGSSLVMTFGIVVAAL